MTADPSTTRRSLRSRVLILFAASLALVALGAAVLIATFLSVASSRARLLEGVVPARLATSDLLLALEDQETGVRGYALTSDPSFLEPYERGRTSATDATAQLRAAIDRAAVDGAAGELDALLQRVDEWSAQWAQPYVAAVGTGAGDGRPVPSLADGKERFDRVRTAAADLQSTLTDAQIEATSTLQDAYQQLFVTLLVELALFAIVLVLILVTTLRSVLRPLVTLGEETRLIVEGDLDHEIHVTGPSELEDMGRDVDRMRRRLVVQLAEVEAARLALERQAAELERSNADLEQFAYVASHDLQEPLRKISGFCQLIQKRYGGQLDERADEYIFYAVDGAHRMQALINDLLAFSRVGRSDAAFERLELAHVVAQAERALAQVIDEAGAEISVAPLPSVVGDARLLTAVFQNLIGNAIKFKGDDPPRVSISCVAGPDEVDICVQDNGIGVDPEYADQIFVIFKRLHTRTEYEGTGIGLALAKKIVEYHGGRLWLEATEGRGSRFHVALPLRVDALDAVPIAPEPFPELERTRALEPSTPASPPTTVPATPAVGGSARAEP